jgi:hypothetical protein
VCLSSHSQIGTHDRGLGGTGNEKIQSVHLAVAHGFDLSQPGFLLALVSAILAEISEEWLTGRTYLTFEGAT